MSVEPFTITVIVFCCSAGLAEGALGIIDSVLKAPTDFLPMEQNPSIISIV
jgi:hypothetical protein